MTRLEPADPGEIDHMRKRAERLAAGLMVLARQSAKPVRVVVEMDTDAGLALGDRRLAAYAPRSARLLAVEYTIKRHEALPRNIPATASTLHEPAADPRPIWSQLFCNRILTGWTSPPRAQGGLLRRTSVTRRLAAAAVPVRFFMSRALSTSTSCRRLAMRTLAPSRHAHIGPLTVDLNRHVLLDLLYRCAEFVTNSRLGALWRRRSR
jgi:hypothetical protein